MPDVVRTPDGRQWYLHDGRLWYKPDDEDLEELVRRYARDEAASVVHRLWERGTYEEERAHTDADVYEEELNELTMAAGELADRLEGLADMSDQTRVRKTMLADSLRKLAKEIKDTV